MFGLPALGLAVGTLLNLTMPATTVLTGLLWSAFLGIIGFQGFFVRSRNAFEDFRFTGAKYIPPALVALAVVSYLVANTTACVLSAVLAFLFGVFIPYWQAVGRSKPFRVLEFLIFAAEIGILVLALYSLIIGTSAT